MGLVSPPSFLLLQEKTEVEPLWELGVTPEGKAESIVYEPSLFHRCPKLDALSVPLCLLLASQQHGPRMAFPMLKSKLLQQWAALFSESVPLVPFLLTLSHPALDHYLSKAKKMPQLQAFIAPVWGDDWPLGGFVVWKQVCN